MPVRVLVATLTVLLWASTAVAPAATRKIPKVPKHWIGMLADAAVFDSRVDLGRELRAMRRAGVRTVRIPFYGARAQPSESQSIDLAQEDAYVLAAARARLRVLPTVISVPPWARRTPREIFSGPSDAGLAFFDRYLRALIARYGPVGTLWQEHREVTAAPLRKWQIWNEPLTGTFWFEATRAEDYVRLLKTAYPAVHAADPRAKVVLGGLVGVGEDALRRLYQEGARGLFDEVAIHPFTYKVANVLRLVSGAREAMSERGDDKLPIALTEVAWPTAYKKIPYRSSYGFEVTEKGQARRVKTAFRRLARNRKRLRISGVVWATWMTTDRGTYPFAYAGLRRLTPNGRIVNKPGYYAFRRVARELNR